MTEVMAAHSPITPGADDASTSGVGDIDLNGLTGLDQSLRSPVHPLADRFFRPARLAKFAFLIGLAVFLPYMIQRLPNLANRPEYRLDSRKIQVIPEPDRPVPPDLLEQICRQNHLPRELSLLDPKLCSNLAAAFSRHPWVSRVVAVRQSYPNGIVVEVAYRRPVAMVHVKGGRIPIDEFGTLLPSEDFAISDVSRYPLIRAAGNGGFAREGGRFTEPGLIGAARIADVLASKWSLLKLDCIELPRDRDTAKAADLQIRLQAKCGSTIIWGRAPGTNHPGELTPAQKVARLEKYVSEFGGFDRPSGPYEIDIRHWQEITRKPVGKPQTAIRKELRTR